MMIKEERVRRFRGRLGLQGVVELLAHEHHLRHGRLRMFYLSLKRACIHAAASQTHLYTADRTFSNEQSAGFQIIWRRWTSLADSASLARASASCARPSAADGPVKTLGFRVHYLCFKWPCSKLFLCHGAKFIYLYCIKIDPS